MWTGLYMATVSAMRCNPIIKPFAERLIAVGKAFKIAKTAPGGRKNVLPV